MPRSRSRSRGRGGGRSRSRGRDQQAAGNKVEEVTKAVQKEGSSESDIVNVAIKQLPGKIRDRLDKLFEEGLLKDNDLDLRSITVFASLNEGLQDRVMTHMENERIYVANARSKSGFLIATCDKAKTGCLDARGLGAIDPWRSALVAMATPKQKMFDLEPERDWLERQGTDPIKLEVNVSALKDEIEKKVKVEVTLQDTAADVKSKLKDLGIKSVPTNKMKLHVEPVGFLKDRLPLAYYNLLEGCELELHVRNRAGTRYRKDHAVPQKRPKTQDKQNQANNPEDHLKREKEKLNPPAPAIDPKAALPDLTAALGAGKAPGLPNLPGLPGLPTLPGLPGLGGAAAPKLGGLPGLAGLTLPGGTGPAAGLGSLLGGTGPAPGLGGLPPALAALGTGPGLNKAGGLPGLPPGLSLGGLTKAGAPGGLDLPSLPKLPGGLELPPGLAKLGGLPPGLSLPTAPLSKGKAPSMLIPGA